ncbi:uncharacterized protein [Ptychodera flava]|uniref:uncharacterized protein n=1 Tax=Ptychodera flava TaxID=63121 RepID=UPI00396A927D
MRAVLLFLLTLTGLTYRPVRSARAELPRYERSILEETENSRCPENAYSAEKTRTGILIVGTEWWPRSKDFSLATVQRDLSRLLLNQGYDVYVTVFDPSEQEMEDAKNHGVRLITSEQLPTSRVLPNVERLLLHKAVFPELHKYINITVVIGYANIEGAADAARSIKDCLFRDASFVLLVTYIPEDTDMKPSDVEDHEYDILEHANIASVVMSLGPAIYLHFENKFRDLFKKPTHLEFFPGFDDILLKTMTTPPDIQEGPIEILMFDFSSTTALNCSNNLQHVALAVGKVADYFSGDRKIKLKIRGLSDEVGQACKESLREIIRSDYVSIHPYPYSENILFKVRKDFRQCHLLLFAPWRDPFGIISFLASTAGVPTLSTEHSGFSEFIKRDMKHHYNIVVVNELGIHVNTLKATEKWERKIIDVLKDPTVYENFLVNAQKLKHDLKKSIISGTIAKSRKMVSAILQNETGIGRPKCIERRGKWKVEKTEGYDKSGRSMVEKADIYGLCLTQNGSLQIDVTVENATPKVVEKVKDQLFRKIKTCEDLPALQKYLHGLGIKCLYTLVNSLSIFVLCPHVQSLDTLWAYYKNNSLERLVKADIMNTEAYEKLDERGIMFGVSIERWRYRRCRLELLYLNQDPDRKHAEVTLTDKNIITLVIIMLFEWTLVVMINSFQTGRSGAITELDNTGVRARVSFPSLECLLLLGVDPKLEVTASVKEFLRHILHANSVTVSRGKNINILYLMVNLTSKTQNVILFRLETLAFLGLRKYVFVNPEILTGVSATVLEEELSRGNYIPVESLSTKTFNLKTKSLLPFKLISRQSTNFYINYSFDLALSVHQTLRKQLKHGHTEIISLRESLRDSERKRVVAESQLKEKVEKIDSAEKNIECKSLKIKKC